MSEEMIAPCPVPWCEADFGSKAIRWPVTATKTTQWAIHCEDCDLYGPTADTKAEAVAAWNAREAGVTDAMLAAGRERACAYCVRIEDFMLKAIYVAMRDSALSPLPQGED